MTYKEISEEKRKLQNTNLTTLCRILYQQEKHMRQAIMTEPGKIEFHDVPVPPLHENEILLRVCRIGICGSDIHVYHGKHPFTLYPVIQGHEFSGTVEKVADGVTAAKLGMKATARPQLVCGNCSPCQRGDYNICDTLKVQGFQAPGCAQDFFVTTTDRIIALPDTLTFEQGALVEPAAVSAHSTSRARDLSGRNVVVLGAGTIGNLVAQGARCRGAKKVLITDISDFRLNIAKECGVDAICNVSKESFADIVQKEFGNEGFNVAFEAVGIEETMKDARQNIQKGGDIVVLGVFSKPPRIDMSIAGDRELSLIGTLMYKHEDYNQAEERIATRTIITSPLV